MSDIDEENHLQNEKLRAEIKKLNSETKSNEQAHTFALDDRPGGNWATARDVLTIVIGVAPMVAVVVALLTLLANQEKDAVIQQREERKFVSEVTERLAHNNPAVRIAAASSLATYLDYDEFREPVTTALIGALLLEPEVTVRGALLASIPAGQTTAWSQTQAILFIARAKLGEFQADARGHSQLIHQLQVDGKTDMIAEVEGRFDSVRARTRALQHAVVGLAVATRHLTPSSLCATRKGCENCRVVLDGFSFDGFDFSRTALNLCNVSFNDSSLVGARFSNLNLTDATFVGSELREAQFRDSVLVGVDFSQARIAWRPETHGERPLAYFTGADLSGAQFSRACLSGADFRGATLIPEQFSDAYAHSANFDLALENALKAAGARTVGPGCQPRF